MASRQLGILACVGAVLLLAIALLTGRAAQSATARPAVSDAWVRLPVVPGRPGAAYFMIMGGNGADRLMAVEAAAPVRAEMHATVKQGTRMLMQPMASLEIAANAHVMFEPGGRHVMLFGLPRTAKPGDRIPLTLRFAQAGAVRIDAVARSGSDAGPHSHH